MDVAPVPQTTQIPGITERSISNSVIALMSVLSIKYQSPTLTTVFITPVTLTLLLIFILTPLSSISFNKLCFNGIVTEQPPNEF